MIKGLIEKSVYYPAIIHKGTPKPLSGHGYGNDLNNYFRIELRDPMMKYSLLDAGIESAPKSLKTADGIVKMGEVKNNFVARSLNVFMSSEDLEETFKTSMQLWSKSGLVSECDRETIYQEREEYEDIFGHTRTRMRTCDKPCPLADKAIGVECPRKCKPVGVLRFYLAPFLDEGCSKDCVLNLHSFYDITSIYESLEKIKQEFGCFKIAPGDFPGYRGMIPLILKRVKINIKAPILDKQNPLQQGGKSVPRRTGKKYDSTMWVVTVEVKPVWAKAFYAWQECKSIKQLGYQPTHDLLNRLPGIDLQEVKVLDVSTETYLEKKEFQEIANIFESGNQHPDWTSKQLFADSLKKIYGNSLSEIPLSEFENIRSYLLTGNMNVKILSGDGESF